MGTSGDVCMSFLAKGRERYIVLYRPETASQIPAVLGKMAANPELSFDWNDAAKLTKAVLEEACQGVR